MSWGNDNMFEIMCITFLVPEKSFFVQVFSFVVSILIQLMILVVTKLKF
jgi:hypothetical protein